MNELLHIKWINHNSQIVHNFQQLQKKQLFCDATIVCDGKCFPVHRLVLSSCSQYFEQIFKETPCAHPFIVLKDVEVEIFRDLVEFMYKGEVNILHNKLPIFISTANSLKVQGISSSDQLKASKSTEDGTSNIANLTKQSDIERKTIKALNVPNVSKESTSWCSLPSHTKTYPPKKTEGRKRELVCSSGQPEKKVRRPKEADNEEVCDDTSDMNYNDTNETDDFKNDMEDIEITENNGEDFLTIVKSEEFKDDEIEITFPDITKLGKESDLTSLPSCSKSFISFYAGRSPTNKEKTQEGSSGAGSYSSDAAVNGSTSSLTTSSGEKAGRDENCGFSDLALRCLSLEINSFKKEVMYDNMPSLEGLDKLEVQTYQPPEQNSVPCLKQRESNYFWDADYQLPDFGSKIHNKLMQGKGLSRSERSLVLNTIFNAIQPFTICPTPTQYTRITAAFLEKYPSLTTIGYKAALISWKASICGKFVNARRREAKDLPEVKRRRERLKHFKRMSGAEENKEAIQLQCKKTCMWKLPHYLPCRPEGENDGTLEEHRTILKFEKKKLTPDYQKVTAAMIATFSDRRHDIVEGQSIATVTGQYPWITDENQIILEFLRIIGKDGSEDAFQLEIKTILINFLPKLLRLAKNSSKKDHLNAFICDYEASEASATRGDCQSSALAISLLAHLLGEDARDIYCSTPEAGAPIYVYCGRDFTDMKHDDVFEVRLENGRITTTGWQKSFVIFFACHIVFNLCYASKTSKTLLFFEKYVLNLDTKTKLPTRVVNLMRKLHELE